MTDYKNVLDNLIDREVQEGRACGASCLVVHCGKELYYHQYGYADREQARPMERDAIIRLFSMSKPVTATAAMILMERGQLDLWDPVSRYLPEYRDIRVWEDGAEVPAQREITVADLLNMTSGITYPDPATEPGRRMDAVLRSLMERREAGEHVDTREYARRIAEVPLCFQPGAKWMYGYSADVLGAVIEAAAGERFGSFLKRELFDPLEMPDTGFYVPKEKEGRFAMSYDWTDEGGLVPDASSHLGEYYGEDVAFESGGAGLVSTIDDYSHFAQMLAAKGVYRGKRILGRKTVEFMAANKLRDDQKELLTWDSVRGYGYGCLMRVLTDPAEACTNATPGEFGWDGWTGNYVTMDAQEDLVFLYFIQRRGAGMTPVVRRLRSAVYAML